MMNVCRPIYSTYLLDIRPSSISLGYDILQTYTYNVLEGTKSNFQFYFGGKHLLLLFAESVRVAILGF